MFATKNSTFLQNDSTQSIQINKRNTLIWGALAFQAGCINAGGFLACFRFVTHTTGFATQFGYDLAIAKWSDALGMLTVPLFFMMGSMISGYYVDRNIQKKSIPLYHIPFFLISFFLALVTTLGSLGAFGPFGQVYDPFYSYFLIALLCLSSGLQNAVTSTASQNTVRTTHLTGHTTDIGIGLIRLWSTNDSHILRLEKSKNIMRGLVICFFILGSALSSFIYLKIGFLGFAVPLVISLALYLQTKKEFNLNARFQ